MEYNVYGSALKNKCKIIFARRLGVLIASWSNYELSIFSNSW